MLGYRAWELKDGRVLQPEIQGEFLPVSKLVFLIGEFEKHHAPRLYEFLYHHGVRAGTHVVRVSKNNIVAEKIGAVTALVRGRNVIAAQSKESVSSFLRTITEHKNKIRSSVKVKKV